MKYTVGVITLSDKGSENKRLDESGQAIIEMLEKEGKYIVKEKVIIPDEKAMLRESLINFSDHKGYNLIITTGGTGLSPRDITPEVTMELATKDVPGISEYIRMKSMEITPRAMLSRGVSVLRNQSLIINLPGSPKAVRESLGFVLPTLPHGLDIMLKYDGQCANQDRISFIDSRTKLWLEENREGIGLCLNRFHADMTVEGLLDTNVGQVISIDGQKYEITEKGKTCHSNCQLFQNNKRSCPLAEGVAFGREIV